MREQSESEFAKQERWRTDVRAFIFALLKHWMWWLSATIGSGLMALCAALVGKAIPFWVFGTAAATGVVFASFRAFCDQRRIAEAKKSGLEEAIANHAQEKLTMCETHADEKGRLEKTIESLRSPASASLEIEIIHPHPVDRDILTGRDAYRIRVKNRHPRKIIKNLKVSIHQIKWPSAAKIPLGWNGIIFPYQLPEKNSTSLGLCELAGESDKEFDLMFVGVENLSTRTMNLAPFRPMHPDRKSLINFVISDNIFPIEHLPTDDSKLTFIFKVSGGDGDIDTLTESYLLKVPTFVSEDGIAGDVAKLNAFNAHFHQYLPAFEKIPAASITPELAELSATIKELTDAKAQNAVAKLTGFGQNFVRRISSINGISPNQYNPDKDDETWNTIADAAAYIVLNLTPEAAIKFDEGIKDIHGYSVPHSGLGSTMYEDRQREILAKLERRFRNLKDIIDGIQKYLKPTTNAGNKTR